jgi:hypothetical protein
MQERVKVRNLTSYLSLITDLEDRDLKVTYVTLEIGSFGHYFPEAVDCIAKMFHMTKLETKPVLLKVTKVANACSYPIFNTRNSTSWDAN